MKKETGSAEDKGGQRAVLTVLRLRPNWNPTRGVPGPGVRAQQHPHYMHNAKCKDSEGIPSFVPFERLKITATVTCLLSSEKINGIEQKFSAANFRNKMSDRVV